MGITHFSIINSNPDIEVSSVADPSVLMLTMIKKYLPVTTYKDYEELITQDKPDALLVCTPPKLHYPIIKKAAELGIHVFVEKPFTTQYAQASELAEIFKANKLVNQVGYVNRFNDVFLKVKELLDIGVNGKMIRFRTEMFSCTITKPQSGSGWRNMREEGGGATFEMASHAIDLINFLMGKPDKVTGSSLNKVFSENVEDIISSTFLYKNGISGTLYVNWSDSSYRKPTNRLEFFGEEGRILADQHSVKIFLNNDNALNGFKKGWNTLYITDIFKPVPFYVRGNEFTRQLYHFVDCINNSTKKNNCSFSDGSDTLEVIEQIFSDYEKNGRL